MKKFLSVILTVLILACPLCSFAAQAAQTIDWYFCLDDEYCDPWIYSYQGELALGENETTYPEDEYCVYYTFNAEKSGYYYVEIPCKNIEWSAFPEIIRDGDAYRAAENDYNTENGIEKTVYKLNAGETVFGIDFSTVNADPTDKLLINIEYLGDSITELTIDEGALDNLIIDVNLYNTDASYISSDVDVVFSGGKKLSFPERDLMITADNFNWVNGVNDASLYFIGYEMDVVVNACEISDIFTDVEFLNLDEYIDVETSYNDYRYEDIYGAKLVFTLADGSETEIDTEYTETVEFNGREHYVYVYYVRNNPENVDIVITIDGITFETYKCNASKTTLAENTGYLFEDILEDIKDSMYYTRIGFSELLRFYDVSDFETALTYAIWYFQDAIYYFKNIFYDISFFFDFYM